MKNPMRAFLLSLVAILGLLPVTAVQADPLPPRPGHGDIEVVGGQDADPGEDPWMAALVIDPRFSPNPFAGLICGASFISPDTLVTAAHCVRDFPVQFLDIVAGSNNLIPAELERLDIRNVRIHPLNDPFTALYDVAAIQLVHPPSFPVTPIDLVTPADAALWEPGDMARFTGWGADETGRADQPPAGGRVADRGRRRVPGPLHPRLLPRPHDGLRRRHQRRGRPRQPLLRRQRWSPDRARRQPPRPHRPRLGRAALW